MVLTITQLIIIVSIAIIGLIIILAVSFSQPKIQKQENTRFDNNSLLSSQHIVKDYRDDDGDDGSSYY